MAEMLALFALVLTYVLHRRLRAENRVLDREVEALKLRVREMERQLPARPMVLPPAAAAAPSATLPKKVEVPRPAAPMPLASVYVPAPPAPRVSAPPLEPVPSPRLAAWRQTLATNWTGVLGAVITVAGVAFFGVYASFKLGPIGRFALIHGFAALLLGGSRWLQRSTTWRPFGAWLQGIAGAIILLACLGAHDLERLRFIDDARIGLAVLGAGIFLNLLFAYLTPHQAIASLHVLLSLTALMVPSPEPSSLVLAAIVTTAGILLSHRSRWDVNLLVCLLAYTIFHEVWLRRMNVPLDALRPYGIGAALLIGTSAALVHYRKKYASPSFELLPFIVHVLNWGALGLNLLHYAQGSLWATVFLAVAAGAATWLARVARKRTINWLFVTDTLIGQVLVVLAISRLGRAGLTNLEMALLCHLELLIFNVIANLEREPALIRCGHVASWITTLVTIACAATVIDQSCGTINAPIAYRLGLVAIATFAYLHFGARKGFAPDDAWRAIGSTPPAGAALSLLTLSVPALILIAHVATYRTLPSSTLAAVILWLLFWYQRQREDQSWQLATWASVAALHGLHAFVMVDAMGDGTWIWVRSFAPLLLLDLALFPRSIGCARHHRSLTYLVTAHVALGTYTLTDPISDFAPGVGYLLLSLLALEGARLLKRRAERLANPQLHEYVLHAGFAFLALFLGRHLLVHLQSELSLGRFSVRAIIEGFALAVAAYWLVCAPQVARDTSSRASRLLAPLLVELFLGLLVLTVVVECEAVWHPVAWVVLALGLVILTLARNWPERLLGHAWLAYLASAIQLGFVASTAMTPRTEWYLRSQYTGPIAIVLQMVFVALAYRTSLWSRTISWPAGLAWIGRFHQQSLNRHHDAWILYPLVLCVAVFLYWRFDRAILTLLWVIEIFLVFALGMFLRQKHFVHVANAALIVCIGRLVLYDLSKTDVSVRAIVFIAVGLLMLGINAIYRKFGDRIGTWQK